MSARDRRDDTDRVDRELTYEDVLRWQGLSRALERRLDEEGEAEGEGCACRPPSDGCEGADRGTASAEPVADGLLGKPLDRRRALGTMFGTLLASTQALSSCTDLPGDSGRREELFLHVRDLIKGNYRRMTEEERAETVGRLERLAQIRRGKDLKITTTPPPEGVLFGYAFNVSKCKGYRECVAACVQENNQDRRTGIQYIRIFEMEGAEVDLEEANAEYQHDVPAEGHMYLGTQCFQCGSPPCVEVCPVGATWKEEDGIVVIDYDWCIGCRYCIAACPYWARRFNWSEPEIPTEEINPNQHYLGNRLRRKGCVEKCTFCIQRSRAGRLTACVEACPTGARVFGNLLDPHSEIRWVLENKQIFRLKAELGTDPQFFYFTD